jgi:hypothetical protein
MFLCGSCVRSHDIKPAELQFDSITPIKNSVYFSVRFHSDTELLELFWREKKARSFDQIFVCALAQDLDFSVTHTINHSAFGLIEKDKNFSRGNSFGYVAKVAFEEVADRRTTSEYLTKDAIIKLLAAKNSIPCKVVVTATGYKAYYTNSLQMPVADILGALDQSVRQ